MPASHCIRCTIQGRVQGVWFRGSTREQALKLGLRGYARNLPDGSVEVLACGSASGIATLREWLRSGPATARVDRSACNIANDDGPHGFKIR